MAKSNKATAIKRVNEIERLLLAGAEFADIRHFASAQGWELSDRQVRRYLEKAYQRLAKSTNRDRNQLLGRHLMQRRVLFGRCMKANDNRTALQVLRDEAELQGLYPGPGSPKGILGTTHSPLSRRERTVRLLAAEARGDKAEVQLLEHATPTCVYHLPDTMMPQQMLHIMAMTFVVEQLEQAALFLFAAWHACLEPEGAATSDRWLVPIALLSAYRYRIGHEGWLEFTRGLGVDADYLVRGNYGGAMLALCNEHLVSFPVSREGVEACLREHGQEGTVQTAKDLARSWRGLFAQVCRE